MVALVESTLESVRLAVEAKEIRLRRVLDSQATVMGDALRLRQVLTNLLNNAVKFTPKGGAITVVLTRVASDMELSVIDSGRGISAEFLPQVFELFRQQDSGMNRRSQGLGLGLTLVKRVVELHGGSVIAESEGEGKGATFRVRLPLSAMRAASSSQRGLPPSSGNTDTPTSLAPSTPKSAGVDLVGLRLLVVEDEEDSRELLRVVLEAAGARVVAAECASMALTLLSSDCFDALISDIGMPEVDGFQFLRELRTRPASLGGKVPAVALTAYTRAVDRTTALRAGFQAHVPKPVDVSELVAVVASVATRL
jgi:CheY-like chemotaxis protein